MRCTRCNGKVEATCPDPEYCQACYDHIEEMCRNPMAHARAARTLLETRQYAGRDDLHMAAFLSIFHPDMPVARAHELARSVR